ncbi:MAG: glycosyltransferase family 2 protein, partial [Ilumatobacteraceae bacterium]
MIPRNPEVVDISAFFPCYNDELAIPKMVRDVHGVLVASVERFEIIVVDDGSSDGSVAVLERLADEIPELQIVRHPTNRGYGGALMSGFAAATSEWVFYTDGDAQYDATELTRCIDVVRADVDIVQGFKLGRGDSWYRK